MSLPHHNGHYGLATARTASTEGEMTSSQPHGITWLALNASDGMNAQATETAPRSSAGVGHVQTDMHRDKRPSHHAFPNSKIGHRRSPFYPYGENWLCQEVWV